MYQNYVTAFVLNQHSKANSRQFQRICCRLKQTSLKLIFELAVWTAKLKLLKNKQCNTTTIQTQGTYVENVSTSTLGFNSVTKG